MVGVRIADETNDDGEPTGPVERGEKFGRGQRQAGGQVNDDVTEVGQRAVAGLHGRRRRGGQILGTVVSPQARTDLATEGEQRRGRTTG